MKNICLLLILLVSFTDHVYAQRLTDRKVKKLFSQSDIMKDHFVGFMLQDEGSKIMYAQDQANLLIPIKVY